MQGTITREHPHLIGYMCKKNVEKGEVKHVKCEICERDNTVVLFERGKTFAPGPVVKCRECGFVYVNPRELERQWWGAPRALDEYLDLISIRRRAYTDRLNKIEQYKKKGRLLDIGCYIGTFLNIAKQNGWQCYGVEPSPTICAYAKKTYGLDIFPGFLHQARFQDCFFDVITMFHVLEHTSSPTNELREIRRMLKPDGLLIIEVPNIDHPLHRLIKGSQLLFVPGHYYYFSPQTLSKLLNKEKFEVMNVEPAGILLSIRRFIQIVNFRLSKRLGQLCDEIARKLKIANSSMKVRTNLNILVIAKPK